MITVLKRLIAALLISGLLTSCDNNNNLNSPYDAKLIHSNTRLTFFSESPKTLDPATSYSSNESVFTSQIYEPPLQYNYLKRPYELEPLTATSMPTVTYLNRAGNPLPSNAPTAEIAFTVYTINLKPGVYYQPHPAFAKDELGHYRYHNLTSEQAQQYQTIADFPQVDTRELTADDYIYQIKRLASPRTHSPILGIMETYIVGLHDAAQRASLLDQLTREDPSELPFLDLRKVKLTGVKKLSKYSYQITIQGKYPQFSYWLAMPFFAPMPWEADKFYSNSTLLDANISLDVYPVGTGAYYLAENNPNQRMVLQRNPNFHREFYPTRGEASDQANGFLNLAGKQLPFIDRAVFTLERESIPVWNKFLQGYYDRNGISADSFDQAVRFDEAGNPILTDEMRQQGLRLESTIQPSISYIGFNMLDPTVGGNSERAQKLRQALSIALNQEEYISIFMNGRGIPAQGPLVPEIFGYNAGETGINPVVYRWQNGHAERRSLTEAKQLLQQAGYPNGIDPKTNKPLVLYYDVAASGGPGEQALFNWLQKQFNQLGIELVIRATQYNRFQEKMQHGHAQLFSWGWQADYPDPENFLFLLYSKNGKVNYGGENAANYANPKYDRLFDRMKSLPNGPERLAVIHQMETLVRQDAPWIFGVHPKAFLLTHAWNSLAKPNAIANNTLKYEKLDPELRYHYQQQWNRPIWWPLLALAILALLLIFPVIFLYVKQQYKPRRRI